MSRVAMCPRSWYKTPAMTQVDALPTIFGESEALSDICRRFNVRRLDLFGSAATGRGFDPARSDLDFLVTFDKLASKDYLNTYFGLRGALEDMSGLPVDLLTDESIKNPFLRRRILSERRLLFQAP